MTPDSSSMDQAVSRAIRASLESLQRQSEELHQAVADLISACGSSRPANALSATLRAQSTAAALGASLEVLGRFIASSGQNSRRAAEDYSPREMETVRTIPAVSTRDSGCAGTSRAFGSDSDERCERVNFRSRKYFFERSAADNN